MKKTIGSIIGAVLFMAAVTVQAQTNTLPSLPQGIQLLMQGITSGTNWAADVGYGRSTKNMLTSKGKNIAFVQALYNFNQNVGVVAGYDWLWNKNGDNANSVRGGITLEQPMRLFSFVGSTFLTNVVSTPFVQDLIATPHAGNAIGNVIVAGADFKFVTFANFSFDGGIEWENRQGQGYWDGNYLMGHLAIVRRF